MQIYAQWCYKEWWLYNAFIKFRAGQVLSWFRFAHTPPLFWAVPFHCHSSAHFWEVKEALPARALHSHISLMCTTEVSLGCLPAWAACRGLRGGGRYHECHCWCACHHQAGSGQHWGLHEALKPLLLHWRCGAESEVSVSASGRSQSCPVFWIYTISSLLS